MDDIKKARGNEGMDEEIIEAWENGEPMKEIS